MALISQVHGHVSELEKDLLLLSFTRVCKCCLTDVNTILKHDDDKLRLKNTYDISRIKLYKLYQMSNYALFAFEG